MPRAARPRLEVVVLLAAVGLMPGPALAGGPAPKTVAVVVDEGMAFPEKAGLPPPRVELSEEVATVLTRALMTAGWTVVIPPPSPPIVRAVDARELGKKANTAFVIFGRARFTKTEGLLASDDALEPTTFPVTGVYELTVVDTVQGAVLGATSGTLVIGLPGESVGAALTRMAVSYDRTLHDIVSRRHTKEITEPVVNALAGKPPPAPPPAAPAKGAK